jgi:diguanylate cyclase (GGDEF)-like protein
MNRSLLLLVLIFGWKLAALAAQPGVLTSLRAIRPLTNAEAAQQIPVAFEATVTYSFGVDQELFVEDRGESIYVQPSSVVSLLPGDRVLVRGKTKPGFRPQIVADSVTLLHHGKLPQARPANFDELIRGRRDCDLVRIRGVVRTADMNLNSDKPNSRVLLQIVTGGGVVSVNLDSSDTHLLKTLLDAKVEVAGVASGQYDGKDQMTGIELNVSSLGQIRILKRAVASPWALPPTPMGEIISAYHAQELSHRILVHGVITYAQPGRVVVLQNGLSTLRIKTQSYIPLRVGDLADATGFPSLVDGFLTLSSAEIQDSSVRAPITPLPATWQQLSSSEHIFDLVSIEGQVVMEARAAVQDEYVLLADGHLFTAIYRHPTVASKEPLPPMVQIPLGSKVRVTGICLPESADAFSGPVPFDVLLRSFDDLVVVAHPSWLSVRNLVRVVALLLLVVLAVTVWNWILGRKVRRQTSILAARTKSEISTERQRSRILEEINGSEPLPGILEHIATLVSIQLGKVPCCCEFASSAQMDFLPDEKQIFCILREPIPARSGPPLGSVLIGLTPGRQLTAHQTEALAMGARLASLAIETRRLNADLLHRSEFDLLTDVQNRFSLEKFLDTWIGEAHRNSRILGLIYIDFDDFKLVNDRYGHRIGDLFLQEVTRRMKGQLRSLDVMARLGGDEFAVLVPMVRSRADVEEIALRLEHCLDEPLLLEGYTLQGSASLGIALYPEDGATRDSLLNASDAAMYRVKHTKKMPQHR